jgi:hypothetical protein
VGHEPKFRSILAIPVHQRFTTTQRSAGTSQKLENQLFRFWSMRFLPSACFFGPAGSSDKQQSRIGPDSLCVSFWRAYSYDGCAFCFGRQSQGNLLDGGGSSLPAP